MHIPLIALLSNVEISATSWKQGRRMSKQQALQPWGWVAASIAVLTQHPVEELRHQDPHYTDTGLLTFPSVRWAGWMKSEVSKGTRTDGVGIGLPRDFQE